MELEILMVVAEISVALAGFSAIVANFSSNWTEADSRQLSTLLTQSGIALFAAMVPLVMSQSDEDIDNTWMVSSFCYIFCASIAVAVEIYRAWSQSGGSSRIDQIFGASFFIAIMAQAYNLYIGAQGWIYLLALLLNIAYAFVSFTMIIRPRVIAKE
ncbi:MAG: hypothetical protein P8P91_11160 [Pseudomonadales bacterium]|nr:hypothetical protein [Pseudomonadales bacterium]